MVVQARAGAHSSEAALVSAGAQQSSRAVQSPSPLPSARVSPPRSRALRGLVVSISRSPSFPLSGRFALRSHDSLALSTFMSTVERCMPSPFEPLPPLDPDPALREESWHCSGCIAYKRHWTRDTWSSSDRRGKARKNGGARGLSDRERGHLRRVDDEVSCTIGRRRRGRARGRTLRALRVLELDDLDLVAPLDALRAAQKKVSLRSTTTTARREGGGDARSSPAA